MVFRLSQKVWFILQLPGGRHCTFRDMLPPSSEQMELHLGSCFIIYLDAIPSLLQMQTSASTWIQ
jgi:hypothetical protein